MPDYLTRTCPVCGGRLCVDVQYPDRVFCDTCAYSEPPDPDADSDADPGRGQGDGQGDGR